MSEVKKKCTETISTIVEDYIKEEHSEGSATTNYIKDDREYKMY